MITVRWDGSDSDYMWFSVPSFTDHENEYTLTIDKASGWIKCECMDAVCRRKGTPLIGAKREELCKHGRVLLAAIEKKLLGDN